MWIRLVQLKITWPLLGGTVGCTVTMNTWYYQVVSKHALSILAMGNVHILLLWWLDKLSHTSVGNSVTIRWKPLPAYRVKNICWSNHNLIKCAFLHLRHMSCANNVFQLVVWNTIAFLLMLRRNVATWIENGFFEDTCAFSIITCEDDNLIIHSA